MGFNRGEIRVKATNIGVMDRKGGESILGCRVMSGAITATASAHSHLDNRIRDVSGDSLHPTMPGTGGHTGLFVHEKKKFALLGFILYVCLYTYQILYRYFSTVQPRYNAI